MRRLLALLFILLPVLPAAAHHGWGDYNVKKRLVLEGEVVAVAYGYPHVSVELQDGIKTLHVILAPPSRMERRGVLPDELVVGLRMTVIGYGSKSETAEMLAETIMLNGRTVTMR
jgi:hypothetical protein